MRPAVTLAAYIEHARKVDGLSLNSPGVGKRLDGKRPNKVDYLADSLPRAWPQCAR
jgi:hypothetical protein